MRAEINYTCKKSKILKLNDKTILLKLYGENFMIWRQRDIPGQNYWDSDVKNNVIAIGQNNYIGIVVNDSYVEWLFMLKFNEIAKIRYSLLKKTKEFILVKIDKIPFQY